MKYSLSLLNSQLLTWFYQNILNPEVGEALAEVKRKYLAQLPIPSADDSDRESLTSLVTDIIGFKQKRHGLNLDLLDYLGTYEDGPTLGERYQPASGLAESVLTDTVADSEFAKLRVTGAQVERDGDRLRVLAVPYVKPEDAGRGEYETLDPVPAMDFFGLDPAQANLIEAFVPHAVENENAGYSDTAMTTISPLDRLEDLTLPKLADVEGGIERYMDARERAAELDEKIERTDELIDEIVYELYGLTEDEIQIVEEAVDG
ncbi:hypothetical protein GCM10008985_21370 [Halococcus dombrowskii]|uniref:Site-specific DNA-methyltransferase (adenine-specific) n=1 Tax=Halococcus dombrowskii TaxID=179637 RepID=A0AAV3SIE0_HALDO